MTIHALIAGVGTLLVALQLLVRFVWRRTAPGDVPRATGMLRRWNSRPSATSSPSPGPGT